MACFSGTFERSRDLSRASLECPSFQRHCVGMLRNLRRPFLRSPPRMGHEAVSLRSRKTASTKPRDGRVCSNDVYKPELDLTDCAWLSGGVMVSEMIKLRSFSPSSSASHQGRSASGFCRSTSVPDVAASDYIPRSSYPNRPATPRLNDTPSCGMQHDRIR
jgi:hypothetical protein